MRVTFYGARGSVPVSGKQFEKYGGNTTCLRIESRCLPSRLWLTVDAGSGIVPLGTEALDLGIEELVILFTHYHHDHTQGFPLCPLTFVNEVKMRCYGPVEYGKDPSKMLADMMVPPYFPVSFDKVASHISGKGIPNPSGAVMVIHPEGGLGVVGAEELEHSEMCGDSQMPIDGKLYALKDCLTIKMQETKHPERAFSYRFEERPTGKVIVFLTDHENTDGVPQHLRCHLEGVDLLVMDSQYDRRKYESRAIGFGHGTPDYCVFVAHKVGAGRLGLTHHDPFSSDDAVARILEAAQGTAREIGFKGEVFACADYLSVEV